jgi:hypothetical protein
MGQGLGCTQEDLGGLGWAQPLETTLQAAANQGSVCAHHWVVSFLCVCVSPLEK